MFIVVMNCLMVQCLVGWGVWVWVVGLFVVCVVRGVVVSRVSDVMRVSRGWFMEFLFDEVERFQLVFVCGFIGVVMKWWIGWIGGLDLVLVGDIVCCEVVFVGQCYLCEDVFVQFLGCGVMCLGDWVLGLVLYVQVGGLVD